VLTSAAEVYDRVRTALGALERRAGRSLTTPTAGDDDVLRDFLEDAVSDVGTETDRLSTSIVLPTISGQEYVARPPYVDEIAEGAVQDGTNAWAIEVAHGAEVARWGRAPSADTGRPTHIGAWEQRLYLFPVPDQECDLDLQVLMNGAASDTPPQSVQDAPLLDTVVEHVPADLDNYLVAETTGRWLTEVVGEGQLGTERRQQAARQLRAHNDEPAKPSTGARRYNILG
jgi:hypothetical protein